mmetsp:Transcript_114111/g.261877  ORF Transcript_114111/g.261877 Transcript_114111/m.261877 type:complete len:236 (-) Transcript_114111:527-1234(-)
MTPLASKSLASTPLRYCLRPKRGASQAPAACTGRYQDPKRFLRNGCSDSGRGRRDLGLRRHSIACNPTRSQRCTPHKSNLPSRTAGKRGLGQNSGRHNRCPARLRNEFHCTGSRPAHIVQRHTWRHCHNPAHKTRQKRTRRFPARIFHPVRFRNENPQNISRTLHHDSTVHPLLSESNIGRWLPPATTPSHTARTGPPCTAGGRPPCTSCNPWTQHCQPPGTVWAHRNSRESSWG